MTKLKRRDLRKCKSRRFGLRIEKSRMDESVYLFGENAKKRRFELGKK